MNKTFKVVFNKARGALMVANEMTNSVQKKGTKTVIGAAVAAFVSASAVAAVPAANTTWSDTETPTSNVINATPTPPFNDTYPVGLFIKSGASGSLRDANISIVANDEFHPNPPAVRALFQRSDANTKVVFDGTSTTIAQKNNYAGTGNSESSAFTNYAGQTVFAATNTTLTSEAAYAEGGKYVTAMFAYGVDGKASILFTGENVEIKATSNVDRVTDALDANRRTSVVGFGVAKEAEIISTAKNHTITVTSTGSTVRPANEKLDPDGKKYTSAAPDGKVGAADAVGMTAAGGQINLANQTTLTVTANGATATGIVAEDSYYTSTSGSVELDGAGVILDDAVIKVTSQKAAAYGIKGSQEVSQGVLVNIKGNLNLDVTSGSDEEQAQAVFMEGGNASIGSDGKTVDIAAHGTSARGIVSDLGASIDVKGRTISVSATDAGGRGVCGYDGGVVNLGNASTESVTINANDVGIFSLKSSSTASGGAAVNVTAKKIIVNSNDMGVHVQNGTQTAVAPDDRASVRLTADEIHVNSQRLGLSAFSNGLMNVSGNLTVTAQNAIDVRGYSTMNINTDRAHTTVLNGDVVFETPNTPEDAHDSGNIINADVNLGLHGEGSVWTGRSYQEYTINKQPVYSVELIDLPYYGNVTGFKADISNGGQWNVTGDSFVNTLTLSDGGAVIGTADAKKLNVEHFTISGANNKLLLAKDALLTVSDDKIKFADANTSLITNLDTAYTLTYDENDAVKTAVAKLHVAGNGGTLVMDDEFFYTAVGLKSMYDVYTTQGIDTIALKNGTARLQDGESMELISNVIQEKQDVVTKVGVGGDGNANIEADKAGAATVKVVDSDPNSKLVKEVKVATDITLVGASDNKDLVQNANGDSVDKVMVVDGGRLKLGSVNQDKATLGKLPELEIGSQLVVENIVASVKKLIALSGANIQIGSNQKAGALHADTLDLSQAGSRVFLDPDFTPNGTIADASFLTAGSLVNDTVANTVIVGQNSVAAFYATQADAVTAFNKMGKTWGTDVTAALYLGKAINVTGSLMVDGAQTVPSDDAVGASSGELVVAPAGVTIASHGMLMIDQPAVGSDTAINGHLTFADGSYLGVVNTIAGTTTLATEVAGGDSVSVVTDNPFFVGSVSGNVLTTEVSASGGMAAIGSTGIQAMTRRADSQLARSIADRTALDQEMASGTNLWVDVTGERYEADHLDHNASFKSDMGYGAFGADVALTNDVTVGAAVQYGKGSLRSSVASIKNDIDNYGFGLYGSVKLGEDAKLVGELAYVKSTNDITSSQTALNQKVDADMYSAGVTAQYRLTAGSFQFVPSVGVRVSRLETDAMQVGAVSIDKQKQTIVQVPVALRVNGVEQSAGGWKLAPSAKVAVVPTFGDKDITVFGVDQTVIDTSPVQADLGIRAVNGNLMLNANFLVGGGKDGASAVGGKVGLKYVF